MPRPDIPVGGHLRSRVTHASKRRNDCVLAHGFAVRAQSWNDPVSTTRQEMQLLQVGDRLGGQRNNVHAPSLHRTGGDSPFGQFEVDLLPFRLAKLTGSPEEQGREPQRAWRPPGV